MIVNTSIPYTSFILQSNIKDLILKYPFLRSYTIGYSVLGRPIQALIFGTGLRKVLYVGSTHSNEFITSTLLAKFIEDLSYAYANGSNINYLNTEEIYNNVSLHVVPMLNPDGVDLVNLAINTASNPYIYAKIIASRYPQIPFPNGWKANIQGVDLKNFQPLRKVL